MVAARFRFESARSIAGDPVAKRRGRPYELALGVASVIPALTPLAVLEVSTHGGFRSKRVPRPRLKPLGGDVPSRGRRHCGLTDRQTAASGGPPRNAGW